MFRHQLQKPFKERMRIMDTVDVHELLEEDAKFVQAVVDLLRKKKRIKEMKTEEKETINFASWPLGVIGKLTRKEIYDYL